MLTQKEQQAMIMFDRLLMAAEENETVADLLDQTLTVARLIDPKADEKIQYGPLQRMHFEWQQMKYRMDSLDKKMDQYINQQNRYGGSTYTGSTGYPLTSPGVGTGWPSNPGWDMTAGGFAAGHGTTPTIGIKAVDVNDIFSRQAQTNDQQLKDISEKLRNIAGLVAKDSNTPDSEAK